MRIREWSDILQRLLSGARRLLSTSPSYRGRAAPSELGGQSLRSAWSWTIQVPLMRAVASSLLGIGVMETFAYLEPLLHIHPDAPPSSFLTVAHRCAILRPPSVSSGDLDNVDPCRCGRADSRQSGEGEDGQRCANDALVLGASYPALCVVGSGRATPPSSTPAATTSSPFVTGTRISTLLPRLWLLHIRVTATQRPPDALRHTGHSRGARGSSTARAEFLFPSATLYPKPSARAGVERRKLRREDRLVYPGRPHHCVLSVPVLEFVHVLILAIVVALDDLVCDYNLDLDLALDRPSPELHRPNPAIVTYILVLELDIDPYIELAFRHAWRQRAHRWCARRTSIPSLFVCAGGGVDVGDSALPIATGRGTTPTTSERDTQRLSPAPSPGSRPIPSLLCTAPQHQRRPPEAVESRSQAAFQLRFRDWVGFLQRSGLTWILWITPPLTFLPPHLQRHVPDDAPPRSSLRPPLPEDASPLPLSARSCYGPCALAPRVAAYQLLPSALYLHLASILYPSYLYQLYPNMGLPQGSVRLIEAIDPITPDNWAKARRTLKMFFMGVHTPWVTQEKGSTEGKIDNTDNDQEVMWLLYSKLAPEYQYLGEEATCAQDLWIACTGAFEASNMTTRMNARRDFVRTIHDPSKPIALYISAIEEAVKRLERLGAKPGDSEIADTLLMNLDDSLSATRITILTAEKEPTLEAIKAQIRNAGPSVPLKEIKKEEDDDDELAPLAAHAARSAPPRSRSYRGTGTSGSRQAPGTSGSHKFHWCSPTSYDQCHCCGTPGHISDRCIHDMPSNVKDWVVAGPPGKSDRASAAFASDLSDDEAAGHLAHGPFASLVDSDTDSEPELQRVFYASMKA
ncbi:hypothetical protein C8R45DRAFT_1164379 [Mycena sanguinolenta]|nr:hypothetical protein C8R45DRAFT_1164379 [Mycena sanguinolenta]